MKHITISIDDRLLKKARDYCNKNDFTFSRFVRMTIRKYFDEDVFGLSELGILPVAIFVMVFHAERDALAFGVFERKSDTLDRAFDAFGSRHIRPALTAERPAVSRSEPHAQVNCIFLPLDLRITLGRVRMRKIR